MEKNIIEKITVTIPSYNQPELLSRALLALSKQTYKNFKVVIIDDKSEVDLYSITSKFNCLLDIKIIRNEKNLGAMDNMFKCIMLETNSPYIFCHHEDDFIKANYLEICLKILEKDSNVSFAITSPRWVKKDTLYIESHITSKNYLTFDSSDFVNEILKYKPFMFGSVIYRKDHLINDWGYEKYNTFCDRYFLTSILEKNKSLVAFISEPGIYVRDHSLDKTDSRAQYANENNLINLFIFYKSILLNKFKESLVDKKITNNLLFSYSNFKNRSPLIKFINKNDSLIKIKYVNLLGIYSLLRITIMDYIYKKQ